MTDDQKLAKLEALEDQAWSQGWTIWSSQGWQPIVNQNLEIIERCQRIRANLQRPSPTDVTTPEWVVT